jgi:hypothetical protein
MPLAYGGSKRGLKSRIPRFQRISEEIKPLFSRIVLKCG